MRTVVRRWWGERTEATTGSVRNSHGPPAAAEM